MKFYKHTVLSFFITFLIQFSYCQINKADTVFLKKEGTGISRHLIYILNDNSFNQAELFKNIRVDALRYEEVTKQLQDSLHPIEKKLVNTLAKGEWMSLHRYDGILYAYSPSEPYTNLYLNVTDSSIDVNDFNDGIIPFLILKVDSSRKDKIAYDLKGLYNYGSRMIFHFLNPQKDIAIVEFSNNFEEKKYGLIAKKNKVLRMPIIINDSPSNRVEEWKFDIINYKAILEGKEKFK